MVEEPQAARPRWIWVFLDTPQGGADAAWEFWRLVTATTLSPRRGDRGQFATLLPADGDPWLKVQATGADRPGLHLDLDTDDEVAFAGHACTLGARELFREEGLVVLASPGGFAFCATRARGEWAPTTPAEGARAVLDQVCLDVPPDAYDEEVAFWAALLGRTPQPLRRPEFLLLPPPDGQPVRLLLQRREVGAGPVRGHPDFATADRAAEVARHEALGARVGPSFPFWTALTAPDGQDYCLTDRRPE